MTAGFVDRFDSVRLPKADLDRIGGTIESSRAVVERSRRRDASQSGIRSDARRADQSRRGTRSRVEPFKKSSQREKDFSSLPALGK